MGMEILTANYAVGCKGVTVNGRDYLEVPVTMIVPGVLPGSDGPLYYPPDEVARSADLWNHTPVVVNHPTADGRNVSARSPEVLDAFRIGEVYRTRMSPPTSSFPDGRLVGIARLDVNDMKRVDPRVLDRLLAKRKVEVSTGLFVVRDFTSGVTRNGRRYDSVARSYQADHLAVLPDTTGACSLADGCGLLANACCDACSSPGRGRWGPVKVIFGPGDEIPGERVVLGTASSGSPSFGWLPASPPDDGY